MDAMQNDPRNEKRPEEDFENRASGRARGWLITLGFLVFAAALLGGKYIFEQADSMSDLTAQNHSLQSTVDQMRGEIGALSAKPDQMTTPRPAQTTPAIAPSSRRAASSNTSAQDRRFRQVQSRIANQQKEMKDTQDQLAAARSDLEGKLGSARDELNGSIARTHDELVALEKRGQRNYYEFDLGKSKTFHREGPIQISLRKADTKHQSYDLMMLVNDHELGKKKVDLYEAVWLHDASVSEPVQVVVNQIEKNRIRGYVSAPKDANFESASNSSPRSNESDSGTVSNLSPTSSSNSSSIPSTTPATSSQGRETPME